MAQPLQPSPSQAARSLWATPPIRRRMRESCVAGRAAFFFGDRKMTARMRIVVVGNGMVGQRFLERVTAAGSFDITVVGEEPRPAYDRVQLSSFFSGKSAEDLNLAPPGFFAQHGITLHLNERVTEIDRA